MTTSKEHFVGHLIGPDGRPQNVEFISKKRPNLTEAERAAGIQWVDSRYEPGDVRRYGAVGDDATDNATAFQAACDQAVNDGAAVHIPAGTFRLGATINIGGPLTIAGSGRQVTLLKKTTATGNLFDIDSDDAIIVRDMSITSTVTQTAGAYFHVDGGSASTLNKYSRFVNLRIGTFYDGIWFEDASGFSIEDCYFVETSNIGIQVSAASPQEPDNGDGHISGCIFDTSDNTGTYAIRQYAAGGLRIVNNKFLNHEYQYSGQFGAGITTSILVMTGNSFENPGTTNIEFDEVSTGSFENVVISGNQITANGSDYGINLRDIANAVIVGNQFKVGSSTTAAILCQSTSEFHISDNQFDGNSASTGISIDSGSSNGYVGVNSFSALTTNISNSSSTTNVARKMLVGTATWDPASMADGATTETDVTVTGAGVNDPAVVNFPGLGSTGVQVGGQVRAADTVHVTFTNHSGGTINPGSSTVTAIVFASQ